MKFISDGVDSDEQGFDRREYFQTRRLKGGKRPSQLESKCGAVVGNVRLYRHWVEGAKKGKNGTRSGEDGKGAFENGKD